MGKILKTVILRIIYAIIAYLICVLFANTGREDWNRDCWWEAALAVIPVVTILYSYEYYQYRKLNIHLKKSKMKK